MKKTPSGPRSAPHPAVGQTVLIMMPGTEFDKDLEGASVEGGMFAGEEKALAYVRTDSAENYTPDGPPPDGDDRNWGSPFLVCEIKRVVRPIPTVKITERVEDVTVPLGKEKTP